MSTIDFQKIYELLSTVLPNSWKKVVFRAEYRDGNYTMKYYVKDSDDKYIDCYDIPNTSEDDIVNTYIEIDKLLFPIRQKLEPNKRWNVITCVIDSDGNIKTEYSYDDIEKDYSSFINKWKKQYLSE